MVDKIENKIEVTVPMPRTMNDRIEDQLTYGDHKSEWIREAIRMRFEAEAAEGNPSAATAD